MHSFWRRKNWAKPPAEPKASDQRARERLTKRAKAGRNIVPLYHIMDAGSRMALLSRKGLLAIAAVIDVARSMGGAALSRPRSWLNGTTAGAASRARPPGPGAGRDPERYQGTSRGL